MKSKMEVTADLLIAAMQAGAWKPGGVVPKAEAESIGEAFEVIYRSLEKTLAQQGPH